MSDDPDDPGYQMGTDGRPAINGEDCLRLDLEYSDGLWNDVPCQWNSPFVCELALDNNTFRGGFIAQSPSPPPAVPTPPGFPPLQPGAPLYPPPPAPPPSLP